MMRVFLARTRMVWAVVVGDWVEVWNAREQKRTDRVHLNGDSEVSTRDTAGTKDITIKVVKIRIRVVLDCDWAGYWCWSASRWCFGLVVRLRVSLTFCHLCKTQILPRSKHSPRHPL